MQTLRDNILDFFKISSNLFWIIYKMFNEIKTVSSNEDFTSMFQKVLERGAKIYAEEVHGKWFEIDSPYDLSLAEKYIDF